MMPAPMHNCGQMPSTMLTAAHRAIAPASSAKHHPTIRDTQLPGFGSLIALPRNAADLGQEPLLQPAPGAVQDEGLLVIREALGQPHQEQLAQ